MKPVDQDQLYAPDGFGNGSCYTACLASLLELPLWMVPPFHQMFGRRGWHERVNEWLERAHGMRLVRTEEHEVDKLPEHYLASGESSRGLMHAVIYRRGELAHDPHPSREGIKSVLYTEHLEPIAPPAPRVKANYVGAPAIFALELACQQLTVAFGATCYLVGSATERPDWRDVDIRMMLSDEAFAVLFPDAFADPPCWEFDPRWLLMTTAISEHLSRVTGLPIDFQFQQQTHANERHKKPRHPIGLGIAKRPPTVDDAAERTA
jgi:hypothetical protein